MTRYRRRAQRRKNRRANKELANHLRWELTKRGIIPAKTIPEMMKQLDEAKRIEAMVAEAALLRHNNSQARNSNGTNPRPPGALSNKAKRRLSAIKRERSQLVLWRKPFMTFYYFLREIPCSISETKNRMVASLYDPSKRSIPWSRQLLIVMSIMFLIYSAFFYVFKHDPESLATKETIAWYSYWVFLGILSSVGLGTGLHTFVLYLGPFIAKVTVAAQECRSVNFPSPPYPDQVICPTDEFDTYGASTWDIMGKIRWESLMWGFGTALGELPPYFMARAARISGMEPDDELEDLNQLLQRKKMDPSLWTISDRLKFLTEDLIQKVGFWGILMCASIPNPLFDLAGITCGHFLVPFATFFGATVIGKALIKAHFQMMFVIFVFNEDLIQYIAEVIRPIPRVGLYASELFTSLMGTQKANLHSQPGEEDSDGGILGFILEKLVMSMVIYFVVSIINSMAQSHHKRVHKELAKNS